VAALKNRSGGTLVSCSSGNRVGGLNVDHVRDRFFELLLEQKDARRAVYYMGAVPMVDLAGAEFLIELHKTLAARGIDFRLAATPSSVREILVKAGYEAECGPVVANETVAAAIAAP